MIAKLNRVGEHQANRYKVEIGATVTPAEQQARQHDAAEGSTTAPEFNDTTQQQSVSADDPLF